MSNEQIHIIKKQRYEIILNNSTEAYTYQSKVSHIQAYQINPILEKIMNTYSSPQFLDKFDEITLDLGTISATNFERELTNKIEEALSDFLHNNTFQNGDLKIGKRIDLNNGYIQQFEFFLKNGYTNWNSSSSVSPLQIFKKLVLKNKIELIALLKKQGRKKSIRKRLINHLGGSFLEQIVSGVAGNEGAYINQYCRQIIKNQNSNTFIETNAIDFRNVIWEITLSYLLVDAGSKFNRKSFLKHLIYKVAQKYRLTYQRLLKTMVVEAKVKSDQRGTLIDFERLLINLHDEEEIKEENKDALFTVASSDKTKPDFIQILHYFLSYNSLPIYAEIASNNDFYKQIGVSIDQNPNTFYTFFNQFLKDKVNIDQVQNKLPDMMLNKMIKYASHQVIKRISDFLIQIIHQAERLNITSAAVKVLQKVSGRIVLDVYKSVLNSPTNEIEELLFQITRYTEIDDDFITILEEIGKDEKADKKKVITSFIKKVHSRGVLIKKMPETILILGIDKNQKLLEKLYAQCDKDISVDQFKKLFKKETYVIEAIQLVTLLVELCALDKRCSVQEIMDWILLRVEELNRRGKQTDRILKQVLHLVIALNTDKVIQVALKEVCKKNTKTKRVYVPSPEKKSIHIQFKKNLIQYYFTKGGLPWWAKDVSLEILKEYLAEMITQFPNKVEQWFVKAKNQQAIIQLMPGRTYEIFLRYINPSLNNDMFSIKKIIEGLLQNQLYGIRNCTPDDIDNIRYIFASYIFRNKNMSSVAILQYLTKNIASIYKLDEIDILVLIREEIRNKGINNSVRETIVWLDKKIASNTEKIDKNSTEIEEVLNHHQDWNSIIRSTSKKEKMSLLVSRLKTNPEALRFYLKRTSLRRKLIQGLDEKEHKDLLEPLLGSTSRLQFVTVLTILKKLRRQVTESQYQSVWYHFMDTTLLKTAIERSVVWSTKDWSLLLFKGVLSISNQVNIEVLISEIALKISEKEKDVFKKTQEFLENKIKKISNKKEEKIPEDIEEEGIGNAIYVTNAGMIILGPYIPMLFDRLGLTEDAVFKDKISVHKAIHILQYAVTGVAEAEEQELILNKIICGMEIHEPVERTMLLVPEEKELVDGLLKAVIANWSILKNTSIEGLRESFLQRNGRIVIEEDRYVLTIEEHAFDMLLDQIPWSIGKLKMSWMKKLIEVIWRP